MSECDAGNGYNGQLGARVSSIFVILVGSSLGNLSTYLELIQRLKQQQVHGSQYSLAAMQQSACPNGPSSLQNTLDLASS